MKKYNLQVAVMREGDPIMFIFNRDYELKEGQGKICVRETLEHAIDIKWVKICGDNEEEINETPRYIEFECKTDREQEDMYLLAGSQGFYGRLYEQVKNNDAALKYLEQQNFGDVVDMVMFLEC